MAPNAGVAKILRFIFFVTKWIAMRVLDALVPPSSMFFQHAQYVSACWGKVGVGLRMWLGRAGGDRDGCGLWCRDLGLNAVSGIRYNFAQLVVIEMN